LDNCLGFSMFIFTNNFIDYIPFFKPKILQIEVFLLFKAYYGLEILVGKLIKN
jgi:hypothetical protein